MTETSNNVEGYLYKKKHGWSFSGSTIKRYYFWNDQDKKLLYYKTKEEKVQTPNKPRGSYLSTQFERVYPDPDEPDRFTIELQNRALTLKGERAEVKQWVAALIKYIKPEMKEDEAGGGDDERATANWNTDQIVRMMSDGQVMTAYFSNNTKKNFTLYCKEYILYACPVNAGIDKAIISLQLRKISDIYVGKQTPGFETEVAAPVPFDRCFTIISRKYTLDVEAKSYQMANYWLAGIKHLLTQSGKAVIVNEQDASKPATEDGHQEGETPSEPKSETDTSDTGSSAAAQAEAAYAQATRISPDSGDQGNPELDLGIGEDGEKPKSKTALVIIDVQYDFCPPDGALAVPGGLAVIPVINKLRRRVPWALVALSQDWHPENHISFFVNNKDNPEAKLFEVLKLSDGREQMMWPAHCIQNEKGAEFHHELHVNHSDKIVKKGTKHDVDSYSAFYDNDHKTKSELSDILKKAGITDVVLTGLAYDYCVGYSALDAVKEGFKAWVVEDATRGVKEESTKKMKAQLKEAGVSIITSEQIPDNGIIPEGTEAEDDDSGDEAENPAPSVTKQLDVEDFLREDFLTTEEQGHEKASETPSESTEHETQEATEQATEPESPATESVQSPGTDTKTEKKPAPAKTTPGEPAKKPAPGAKTPAGTKPPTGTKPTTGAKPVGTKPPGTKPVGTKPVVGTKPAGTKTPGTKPAGTKPGLGTKPRPDGKKGVTSPSAVNFHAKPKPAPRPVGKQVGKQVVKPVRPGVKPGVTGTPAKPGTKPGPAKTPGTKPGIASPTKDSKRNLGTTGDVKTKPAGTASTKPTTTTSTTTKTAGTKATSPTTTGPAKKPSATTTTPGTTAAKKTTPATTS